MIDFYVYMIDSMIQVINYIRTRGTFREHLIEDIPTKNPKDEMDISPALISVHPLNHGVYHLNLGV